MRAHRLACLLLALAACGGGSTTPDAFSPPRDDAFVASLDAPGTGDDAPSTDDAFSSPTDDAFAASDAPSTGDAACMRPMTDLTELGSDCSDMPCPTGLECLEFTGIVLQHYCGIRCEASDGGDCACPDPLVCETVADKAGPRRECVRPDI